MRLVLATANPFKVAELRSILHEVQLVARPADVGEVEESGETLEDNARLKAETICRATGEPAIADDTALEVDALDGSPGVRSARFAGEDADPSANVAKLLSEMQGRSDRRARFRTVAVVAFPDGREIVAEGTVEGAIARAPRGEGGFGYDPVFVPEGAGGVTFAEMTAEAKNAMSHRGRAFRLLSRLLAGAQGDCAADAARGTG